MTVYVCLDQRNGMLFNHRRQSRDAAVLEDLGRCAAPLHIDAFSEKLAASAGITCEIAPEDLSCLPENAHFFLETRDPDSLLFLASQVVIYRWNRHYPADTHWNADLAAAGFRLTETTDFPGKSHETITKEVYTR